VKTQVLKYLIFVTILCVCFAGCAKYHSKSEDAPKSSRIDVSVTESPFVDYDYGDFEEIDEDDNVKNVYHVKVVRMFL
jgi:hypothetical protein